MSVRDPEHPGFVPGFTPDGLQHIGVEGALRWFERQEVFLVRLLEGEGREGNPFREVTYWLHPDGWIIHRHDAYALLHPAEATA